MASKFDLIWFWFEIVNERMSARSILSANQRAAENTPTRRVSAFDGHATLCSTKALYSFHKWTRLSSFHLAWHCIADEMRYHATSDIPPRPVASRLVPFRPILISSGLPLSRLVPSLPVSSRFILSHLIPFCLVLSRLVYSRPVSFRPVSSCPIPSLSHLIRSPSVSSCRQSMLLAWMLARMAYLSLGSGITG